MTGDEIRLVIPAEEEFRPIAHLVAGGLALRHDVTYDDLEDLQVAIEALLTLRDDEGDLAVVLSADDGLMRAAVGPFDAGVIGGEEGEAQGLDLRRVLETVCDTHEVEQRDDGSWVELTKRVAQVAGSAGSEAGA